MSDYNQVHSKRFQESLRWIAPHAEKAQRIFELGGSSAFTELVGQRWPGKLLPEYGGDLRDGFEIYGVDLILCQEVLEHLHDQDEPAIKTDWKASGVRELLLSCYTALNPGGILFLTTPNPCSITAIHHALNQQPPMIYDRHTREYPPYQLDAFIQDAGFEILTRECLDVWRNAISERDHMRIQRFIRTSGYSLDLRGEDYFCLAQKPAAK